MVLTDDAKNAMLQGLANKLNAGNGSKLSIYVDATLAVEITLLAPVEASITGATLTLNKPPDAIAIASGVPTSAQILDSTGVLLATLDPSEFTIDKDKIYMGGYVGITTMTLGI